MEPKNHELDRTTVEFRPSMHGHLEVHTTYRHGEVVQEAFTLASLSEVLNLPMSTIEGRYVRGRLKFLKVDIHSRYGRPMRGFRVADLATVAEIIRTPGAVAKFSEATSHVFTGESRMAGPLIATPQGGVNYFTIAALADHFGCSTTTCRNKLERAGLMRHSINLGTSMNGGRPKRGFPETMIGDIKSAIVDGVSFQTAVDRAVFGPGERAHAQEEMLKHVITEPQHRAVPSLFAGQPASRSIAAPKARQSTDSVLGDVDAWAAQLEANLAAGKIPAPLPPHKSSASMEAPPLSAAQWLANKARVIETIANDNNPWQEYDIKGEAWQLNRALGYDVGDELEGDAAGFTLGRDSLYMDEEAIDAFVQETNDAWERNRAARAPAVEAVKQMARAVMIDRRETCPSDAEYVAFTYWLGKQKLMDREEAAACMEVLNHWGLLRRAVKKLGTLDTYQQMPEFQAFTKFLTDTWVNEFAPTVGAATAVTSVQPS